MKVLSKIKKSSLNWSSTAEQSGFYYTIHTTLGINVKNFRVNLKSSK